MRIYLSGDEDTCKWHLPVIESMLHNWVSLCRREGLQQNTFHHIFEDTSTEVHAQYIFGQTSVQVHSPHKKDEQPKKQEESKDDLSCPRTFFIETTQGFFWVIVRRDSDGKPIVTLEKFQAMTGDILQQEYIYPAMGQQTAGIVAGVVDEQRFIVTQKAGVFAGKCGQKGSVVLPAANDNGKITVVDTAATVKEYVVIAGDYAVRKISRVLVSGADTRLGVVVELQYGEANVELDCADGSLNTESLQPNPCWVHRKCTGSYYSPQKTIGFHVDIGSDDDRLGNIDAVHSGGQDKLEPMFNHTGDLYAFSNLLNFPMSVSGSRVCVAVVSPTMAYLLPAEREIPWGGYGWDYGAGCADYQQDFRSWILAPRVVFAEVDLVTGAVGYSDPGGAEVVDTNLITNVEVFSFDKKFSSRFIYKRQFSVGTDRLLDSAVVDLEECPWTESVSGRCDSEDDSGYTGTVLHERVIKRPLIDYGREEIKNRRLLYFVAGGQDVSDKTSEVVGFYHLFEGLWHLDVAVMWTTSQNRGELCQLCSVPRTNQSPGQYIWFFVNGDVEDIIATGHEYVENLEVTVSLGLHPVGGVEMLAFQAKVPDEFAAPHEAEVLIGGVEYTSGEIGKITKCERALMSTPCTCEGNPLVWDEYATFTINGGLLDVNGGCAPFNWRITGGMFIDVGSGENLGRYIRHTKLDTYAAVVTDDCAAEVFVVDACGVEVSKEAVYAKSVTVSGPSVLDKDERGTYYVNLDDAIYTGELNLIENTATAFVLEMPSSAVYPEFYTVSWVGRCGTEVSMVVQAVPECGYDYDFVCDYGKPAANPAPNYSGAATLVLNALGNPGYNAVIYFGIYDVGNHTIASGFCPSADYWTVVVMSGYFNGYTVFECTGLNSAHWHPANKDYVTC